MNKTAYQAFARVTVVLDVAVDNVESKLDSVDLVRELVADLAVKAITEALKAKSVAGEVGPAHWAEGVTVATWPEAVTMNLQIQWSKAPRK